MYVYRGSATALVNGEFTGEFHSKNENSAREFIRKKYSKNQVNDKNCKNIFLKSQSGK